MVLVGRLLEEMNGRVNIYGRRRKYYKLVYHEENDKLFPPICDNFSLSFRRGGTRL